MTYIIVITLFACTLAPREMQAHAASVMAVGLLFWTLAVLPQFYERDDADGTLEQFLLQPAKLEMLALARIAGLWLAGLAPLLIVSPLLAVAAGLGVLKTLYILLLLALAMPTLLALGSISAAFALNGRKAGALAIMLLYLPVLLLAASKWPSAPWLLIGLALVALPLSCMAASTLIRINRFADPEK